MNGWMDGGAGGREGGSQPGSLPNQGGTKAAAWAVLKSGHWEGSMALGSD